MDIWRTYKKEHGEHLVNMQNSTVSRAQELQTLELGWDGWPIVHILLAIDQIGLDVPTS